MQYGGQQQKPTEASWQNIANRRRNPLALARGGRQPNPDEAVFVTNRDGVELKAKEAQIWLANIPFVRMREAIIDKHQLNPKNQNSFAEIVAAINDAFEVSKLTLYVKTRSIQINDGQLYKISPQYFAFLHWFADFHHQDKGIAIPTIAAEDIEEENKSKAFSEWSTPFNKYYGLQKAKDDIMVDKKFFEQTKSKLRNELVKRLGSLEIVNRIMPIKDENGELRLPVDLEVVIDSKR